MSFRRFEHVNQACADLDVTRRFYQTLFPEWRIRAEGSGAGWHWIHLGDDQFYMALNQAEDPGRLSQSTGHVDHIGFVIEVGQAMQDLFQAHGIPYELYTSPETRFRLYIYDPDGTQIELVEYQPS
ncbi:MAG: VOC family protein [Cyanobacteriota bacterium]